MSNEIIANPVRIGRFTSSQMSRLMSNGRKAGEPGAPFHTYVQEKIWETKVGRSMDTGVGSRSTAWGECMEMYLFSEVLGLKYVHKGKETSVHPTIDTWSGSPDLVEVGVKVAEVKCYEPKNFCKYADVLLNQDVALFRDERPVEYWQLVSNAVIHGVNKAEAILFMPYRSRLPEIRQWVDKEHDTLEPWRYRFIFEGDDSELPYVSDDSSHYTELITFEFEVPQEDIDALTSRVQLASKLLKEAI